MTNIRQATKILAGLLICPALSAQAYAQSKEAPNPAFRYYVKQLKANKAARAAAKAAGKTLPHKFMLGALPMPIDLSHTKGVDVTPFLKTKIVERQAARAAAAKSSSSISAAGGSSCAPTTSSYGSGTTFNLNTCGYVTPVRDQESYEDCWSFASMGSVESNLLFNSSGTYTFSENNLATESGFDWGIDDGGVSLMSTAYMSRWQYYSSAIPQAGPVLASDDNDSSTQDGVARTGLTVQKHLQDVVWIPPSSGGYDSTYVNNIKTALQAYGAGYSTFYVDFANFNSDSSGNSYTYYFTKDCSGGPYGGTGPNDLGGGTCNTCHDTTDGCGGHAVTLVGWDDDFPASKFTNSYAGTPSGNGAFILKNSWGSKSTDGSAVGIGGSGYFYISYYDTSFGGETAFFNVVQSTTNYDAVYQYDPLGWTDDYPLSATSLTYWMSNIFTASASQSIAAAAFYTNDAASESSTGTSYNIYVYTGVTAGSPRSGTLAYSGSGSFSMPGFHTVALTTPVAVTSGTNFSVVVKLTNTSYERPIAIEEPYSDYSSNATASSGQSYVSANGSTWTDLNSVDSGSNVALKAYAVNVVAPSDVLDGTSTSSETSYTASASQLSANWTASTGNVSSYQYEITSSTGGSGIVGWTSAGTATSVTATGLSLTNGATYYFSVRSVYNGSYSGAVTSSGQTVDSVAPTMGTVYDGSTSSSEKSYSKSLTALSANWSASDMVGVSSYTYAIGSTSGGTDIVGWTSTGTATGVTATGLSLTNGTTYYFSVYAYNMAGLASSKKISAGAMVDTSVPTTPAFSSEPAAYYAGRSPVFSWSASDTVSGIAGYAALLASGSSCTVGSAATQVAASSTPYIASDGQYTFCVAAVSGSGAEGAQSSYTFSVLASSPALSITVSTPIAKAEAVGFTLYSNEVLLTTPTVTVTQTGASAASVTMTSSTGTVWAGSYTVSSAYGNGTGTISVLLAQNLSGNYSTATKTFVVDVTPPSGTIAVVTAQPFSSEYFTMNVTESDSNVNTASTPTVTFSDGVNSRSCTLSYVSGSTWTATGFIDSDFSSGTAHVYMTATDLAGNTTTAAVIGSFTFNTSVGGTSGGSVVATDSTTITVSAGANGTTSFYVTISTMSDSNSTISGADSSTGNSISLAANLSRSFTAYTTTGSSLTTLESSATIKLYYPGATNGYVTNTIIPVSTLGIYYLNPSTSIWNQITSSLDSSGYYLTAQTEKLGTYAIRSSDTVLLSFSGLSTVRAYPNPCDFRKYTKMTLGGVGSGVTGLEIRIYTLAGQLVRTYTSSNGGITSNVAQWDGKNESGQKVASGIYIVVFRATGYSAQTFKAAIIW
jgi:C1A family cysteine protease